MDYTTSNTSQAISNRIATNISEFSFGGIVSKSWIVFTCSVISMFTATKTVSDARISQ